MIEIIGTECNQWDTGRSVKVTNTSATHVHFANTGDSKAVIMEIVDSSAKIPDYLFQTGKQLCVYLVENGVTVERKIFTVRKRERPENYIYDDDQRNYIYELIRSVENAASNANTMAAFANESASSANTATESANNAANEARAAANETNVARENIVNEATEVMAALTDAAFAVTIECSATGDVIAVSDASDSPLHGISLYGKTTQNGTPSPDSPVELKSVGDSGTINTTVCGKNLCVSYKTGAYANATGVYNINFANYYCTDILPVNEKTLLAVSTGGGNVSSCLCWGLDDAFLGAIDWTAGTRSLKAGTAKVAFNITSGSDPTWVQIECGRTATGYEPYKGQNLTIFTPNGLPGIPVSSGGNYTDANGQQWVANYRDYGRGVEVESVLSLIFDGSETWENPDKSSNRYSRCALNPKVALLSESSTKVNKIMCSHFTAVSAEKTYFGEQGVSTTSDRIHFSYGEKTASVDAWKEYLASQYQAGTPVEVQVLLATPIETPIPEDEVVAITELHSNKPNTTVFNDDNAGMCVAYVADTKAYIDNKFNELAAALVNNT